MKLTPTTPLPEDSVDRCLLVLTRKGLDRNTICAICGLTIEEYNDRLVVLLTDEAPHANR